MTQLDKRWYSAATPNPKPARQLNPRHASLLAIHAPSHVGTIETGEASAERGPYRGRKEHRLAVMAMLLT